MDQQITLIGAHPSNQILLTAVANVFNNRRSPVAGRILLDTGSTSNFITNSFAEKLNIPRKRCSIPVGTLNGLTTYTKWKLKISVQSRDGKYQGKFDCLTIPSISQFVPVRPIPKNLIEIPKNIKLADPEFYKPAPIDILLGSGPTLSLLCIGQIKMHNQGRSNLYLQKTQLGWVIGGDSSACNEEIPRQVHHVQLHNMLSKFWEIEEGPKRTYPSPEEIAAEEHFRKYVRRDQSGKYIVALPFNEKKVKLGQSIEIAQKRLNSLENKFKKNPSIRRAYEEVINEYITLGHMTKASEENPEGLFLPHHAVIKETSITTKLRVVFDGSAKTSSGVSLNEALMIGPTIQDDLFSLVLRFRFHKYVLTGDIEKMYRQFWVREEDRKYQQILWRDETDKITTFQLNTVTFGLSAAPFLAIRSLHQLARDHEEQYPQAARILLRDMYVDDLLTGFDSLADAQSIQRELIECLKRGGLNIRQWASNDPELLRHLPKESINQKLFINDNKTLKTLGVFWNSETDTINYSHKISSEKKPVTKREILSDIASIFDPLGLLGPTTLTAKHVMQQLWAAGIEWDESVPTNIYTQWVQYYQQLPLLNNIHFKRHVVIPDMGNLEIHGFADASSIAYGACLYVRSTNVHGQIKTQLLCSRSRVAPLKTISIPRLELCAALTLVELYNSVQKAIRFDPSRVVLWSDSMITLHWISKSPHLLQTFVANRVTEIQKGTKHCEWRHIGSADNPADALSRGQLPADFTNNALWQVGPTWLNGPEEEWPKNLDIFPGTEEEFKTCLNITIDEGILNKFSCIHKAERIIALCLRFMKSCRKKTNTPKGPLSVDERNEARLKMIKMAQALSLPNDLKQGPSDLKKTKQKYMSQLNAFIDDQGLWRVGGRLQHANILYDQKHPIILPQHNHVTDLIIREHHLSHLHSGTQTTLYALRQRYWPLGGKAQIRKIIWRCVECNRARPIQVNYTMGNLPTSRVTSSSSGVFQHVGVDYAGPMSIKERKHQNRKQVKAYVAIFVCMASKAVHLELVSDLTSIGFIGALRRFVSRRGRPRHIYSDNGTNFVGANRELKQIIEELHQQNFHDQVSQYLGDQGIDWHFSPPLSPNFGGLWEAATLSSLFI
ncbi:uncharacterized protein LOC135171624 [Diachasmimorpha longicaudata]|uniref:uncharacterized protein LOC135171624 n=1 Tax=Diachasmimorpha longicaudata TaxID=58733 RepID=UPI0030B89A11